MSKFLIKNNGSSFSQPKKCKDYDGIKSSQILTLFRECEVSIVAYNSVTCKGTKPNGTLSPRKRPSQEMSDGGRIGAR